MAAAAQYTFIYIPTGDETSCIGTLNVHETPPRGQSAAAFAVLIAGQSKSYICTEFRVPVITTTMDSPSTASLTSVFGSLAFWVSASVILIISSLYSRDPRRRSLPPGPTGIPILGNLLQIGRQPWIPFTQWRHTYGPLLYINIAGTDTLILSSQKVATDLLDRRSAIYSDRPRNIVSALLSGGNIFALAQPNNLWRRMRREAHETVGPEIAKSYHLSQERDSVLLVSQMMHEPNNFHHQICRANGSISMSVIYGMPPVVDPAEDTISKTNAFTERLLSSAAPGAFLVHHLTWLEHLPRWMTGWRQYAEFWYKHDSVMFQNLFTSVAKRVEAGDDGPSVVSTVLKNQAKSGLTGTESSWLAATLFAASAEALSSQMEWFLVSMILHPKVQEIAQAELDAVVGRERMPTLEDYDRLPFIRAVVKEVFRWRTTVPLGIPHQLAEDDWYAGYFLPKNSLIFANIWDLHKDTEVYGEDVDVFRPERHLTNDGDLKQPPADTKDESHFSYGFGRRICVGRHLANRTIFIQVATILWSFKILPGKNSKGVTVLPDPDAGRVDGLVVRPSPFTHMLSPRFSEVEGIIGETLDLHGLGG
ncbi:cytochrome P450 [Mycena rebaudengoi]|nr:cytochrome P450 [Mycena rebaudengoi]